MINHEQPAPYSGEGLFTDEIEWGLDFAGAAVDFFSNYWDMQFESNVMYQDKYFHCKANYEAASRGAGGRFFAELASGLREYWWGQQVKGESIMELIGDQEANIYGRSQASTDTSGCPCQRYRPRGLNPRF